MNKGLIPTIVRSDREEGINIDELQAALAGSLAGCQANLRRVLLIPPDLTRLHSAAGLITRILYRMLHDRCTVDILPAIGTHDPMNEQDWQIFFGPDVPFTAMIEHRWRDDVVKIGEVPGDFVATVSENLMGEPIDVAINKHLLNPDYDLIISVGQVVPHEVAGMANFSKNILVGCGGSDMINRSHMLGAFYGMERIMGRDHSPVRQVFDFAETHFLARLPIHYILTVTSAEEQMVRLHGLFIGRERTLFEQAVRLSQQNNLIILDQPLRKVVVYLDPQEFKSTWLGNKAVYRTRLAMAEGGELLILAPGVRKFGEDSRNDSLIRKYGYAGRQAVIRLSACEKDLQDNLSVAAHLIHGSSDGRFTITYATGQMSQAEIESVHYRFMPFDQAWQRYDPDRLQDGLNILPDGEEIFFIRNPALGLWAERSRFPDADPVE